MHGRALSALLLLVLVLAGLVPLLTPARPSGRKEDLWEAARRGDARAVEALLARGVDVNARAEYGATALSFAADRGRLEVVRVLLRHGADVNVRDTFYRQVPLDWAVLRGHAEVARALVAAGADAQRARPAPRSGRRDGPEAASDAPELAAHHSASEEQAAVVAAGVAGVVRPANWPSFRGPNGSGVADGQMPPTTWDAAKGSNVLWKTPIPGLGHSCPVVWGERVFVTTAVGTREPEFRPGLYGDVDPVNDRSRQRWQVYCLDRHSGRVLWERTAHEGVPAIKRHPKSSHANPTPATDGEHVVAFFGSEGLYCYDVRGRLLWKNDLGVLASGWFYDSSYEWGFGSSPVLYRDRVIVQCDVGKNSFLAAYHLKDGRQLWRTARNEVPSWGTPTLVEGPNQPEVVTNATRQARGYDPWTGRELWRLGPQSEITVPTPVFGQGLIFITSGYRPIQPIYAVRPGAQGDLSLREGETSSKAIAWSSRRGGPYLPTPVVYGDHLYVCSNDGILTCYQARTGRREYRRRLGGAYTASPVASDGKLYLTSEESGVRVIAAGPAYRLLASNPLGEACLATPAISGGVIFFRTRHHVIAVGRAGR